MLNLAHTEPNMSLILKCKLLGGKPITVGPYFCRRAKSFISRGTETYSKYRFAFLVCRALDNIIQGLTDFHSIGMTSVVFSIITHYHKLSGFKYQFIISQFLLLISKYMLAGFFCSGSWKIRCCFFFPLKLRIFSSLCGHWQSLFLWSCRVEVSVAVISGGGALNSYRLPGMYCYRDLNDMPFSFPRPTE